jgi:hypothetical protein
VITLVAKIDEGASVASSINTASGNALAFGVVAIFNAPLLYPTQLVFAER